MQMLDLFAQILPDKPDLSRWSLKYKAFGRDIEFSWLARNMQEKIPNLILYLFFSINSLYLQLLFVIHVISPSCSPFQIRKFTGDLWKVFQTGRLQGHFLSEYHVID